MARRIDAGFAQRAHTAIQAMIGRARITANRDRKRVGVVCDLANDELAIVDLSNGCPDESKYIRVVEPSGTRRTVVIHHADSKPAVIPLGEEETQCC